MSAARKARGVTKVATTRSTKAKGKRTRDESEDEATLSSDSSSFAVDEPKPKAARVTRQATQTKKSVAEAKATTKRGTGTRHNDESGGESNDEDDRPSKRTTKKDKRGRRDSEEQEEHEPEAERPKPQMKSRSQPKRKQEEDQEDEEEEETAVPKTPQLERAKAVCASVKRHLARPLEETLDQTQLPQTPSVAKLRGNEMVAKRDYDELLQRFTQLKALRTTEVEKMYAKHQASTDARLKTSDKLIEQLKAANHKLEEELAAAKKKLKEKQDDHKRRQDGAELEETNATLRFLRELTLIDIKPHPEDGPSAFLCSCKNPSDKRALCFVLSLTEDAVEYKPVEIGKQPKWEINEMFIKEIYFSPAFAPVFLSKLLATVFGTKKAAK